MARDNNRLSGPGGRSPILLIVALLAAAPAVAGVAPAQDGPEGAQESAREEPEGAPEESFTGRTWAEVREAYEKARQKAVAMGESAPDRIPDWVKDDLANVGDWEYRVVETPRDKLETTLNALGADRWECFSIDYHGKKAQLVFKRRKRSRLRELKDLSPENLLTVIKLMREHRLDEE